MEITSLIFKAMLGFGGFVLSINALDKVANVREDNKLSDIQNNAIITIIGICYLLFSLLLIK